MDSQHAKEILASYRVGTDDVRDPFFTDALAQAERDPKLGRWLESQQMVDGALQIKFRETAVPAGLPERILASRKVSQPKNWSWPFTWMGFATAAAALLVALLGFWMFRREPDNFAAYRNRMANLVSGEYKMMLETKDHAAIRQFLAQNHGHDDYVLTTALEQVLPEGCTLVDWHGKRVSLICLDRGSDSDLFLFVIDHTAIPDAPSQASAEFASVGPMTTATWTRGNRTYLLATRGDAEQLRKYL